MKTSLFSEIRLTPEYRKTNSKSVIAHVERIHIDSQGYEAHRSDVKYTKKPNAKYFGVGMPLFRVSIDVGSTNPHEADGFVFYVRAQSRQIVREEIRLIWEKAKVYV